MATEMLRNLGRPSVRQGLAGNLNRGKSAGGRAYGYQPEGTGELKKVDAEAEVILRIFQEYAAGKSPVDIAEALTKDGVSTPRGEPGSFWRASTITGSSSRGYGLLSNSLYHGVRTWNRVTMLKNPDTGRRVSRINPKSEWMANKVPDLRIVPEDLWEKVQARRQKEAHVSPGQQRRPVRLSPINSKPLVLALRSKGTSRHVRPTSRTTVENLESEPKRLASRLSGCAQIAHSNDGKRGITAAQTEANAKAIVARLRARNIRVIFVNRHVPSDDIAMDGRHPNANGQKVDCRSAASSSDGCYWVA